MLLQKTIGFLLIFISGSVSCFNIAKSDIIRDVQPGEIAGYRLNGKAFSDYSTISSVPPHIWVDLGQCGTLTFTASFQISDPHGRHTLTVSLKRDGVTIATEDTMTGPSLFPKAFWLDFPQMDFSPGEWTIEWQFLSSPQQGETATIGLIAPRMGVPPPYDYSDFCNSPSSYSNNLCDYRPMPPTGFIYNNAYYRTATSIVSSCPSGIPYVIDLPFGQK